MDSFSNFEQPTLSVLLPTAGDRGRLLVQLDAIVPQLIDGDELILLNDGADVLTDTIADLFPRANIVRLRTDRPSGVCKAYNRCAAAATKSWVLGASGNDEVQPGALELWRSAARAWPEARVMFGHIVDWKMKPWLPETGFVHAGWLPAIWLDQGWQTHGAAAFLRRDCWGKGYIPELGYMADHFQTMLLAYEYGCVYLHANISRVWFHARSFSQAHGNLDIRNGTKAAWMTELARPEYDRVRPAFELFDRITGWSKKD